VSPTIALFWIVLALHAIHQVASGSPNDKAAGGLSSPLAPGGAAIVSINTLRDTDEQTATTAAESWLHAASEGDASSLVAKMRWTWRENAHRHFADLPAPWMEKAGSPERLFALAEVAAFAGVDRVQVFTQVIVSATEEILAVRAFGPKGRATEHLFWMRWSGGRWLRVVTSSTIARLARLVAASQPLDTTDTANFREQYGWIVPQTGPKPALSAP
jgi:hypothetical protein